jgi:hypothetical protein
VSVTFSQRQGEAEKGWTRVTVAGKNVIEFRTAASAKPAIGPVKEQHPATDQHILRAPERCFRGCPRGATWMC